MIIGRIFYPVTVLGWGKRLGIWTCGCTNNCKNCISPELKNVDNGKEIRVSDIEGYIHRIKNKIDGVTISGGEPFQQVEALAEFVEYFNKNKLDDILVYSGYLYEDIIKMGDKAQYILENIAVLIEGAYYDELNDGIGIRGSSNQKIHIFKYSDRHEKLHLAQRKIQSILLDGHTVHIGIPGK